MFNKITGNETLCTKALKKSEVEEKVISSPVVCLCHGLVSVVDRAP